LTGQALLGGQTNISSIAGTLGSSKTTGISSSNPFQGYYTNPYSKGVNPSYSPTSGGAGGTTSQGSFGAPIYGTALTTTSSTPSMSGFGTTGSRTGSSGTTTGSGFGSTGTNRTGTSGFGTSSTGSRSGGLTGTTGLGSTTGLNRPGGLTGGTTLGTTTTMGNTSGGMGWNTAGMNRTPSYGTNLGSTTPMIAVGNPQLQLRVQNVVLNSTRLPSRSGIRVGVVGQTVVLQGTVSDDHERRLAESIIRLTPGVRDVQNQLVIPGA
jgi:hypothetical protein